MDASRLESLYFSAIGHTARAHQAIVTASSHVHPGYHEWNVEMLQLKIAELDLERAAADIRAAYKLLAGLK